MIGQSLSRSKWNRPIPRLESDPKLVAGYLGELEKNRNANARKRYIVGAERIKLKPCPVKSAYFETQINLVKSNSISHSPVKRRIGQGGPTGWMAAAADIEVADRCEFISTSE